MGNELLFNAVAVTEVSNTEEQLSQRSDLERNIILKAMEDQEFRRRLLSNPKAVLEQEFSLLLGKPVALPASFNVAVLEETDDLAYLVLPRIKDSPAKPAPAELDPDAGLAYYCTTVTCKPTWSC